jgi:hypothetical protein
VMNREVAAKVIYGICLPTRSPYQASFIAPNFHICNSVRVLFLAGLDFLGTSKILVRFGQETQ